MLFGQHQCPLPKSAQATFLLRCGSECFGGEKKGKRGIISLGPTRFRARIYWRYP